MSSIFQGQSGIFPVVAAVVIIVIAIAVSAAVHGPSEKPYSQIITVGPVWPTDAWQCSSDANFMIYGTIRGIAPTPLIQISVASTGTQSFYGLNLGMLESFSIGGSPGELITITRTGSVTGFITLETAPGAVASCTGI